MTQNHTFQINLEHCLKRVRCLAASAEAKGLEGCAQEEQAEGMTSFLDSLKWNSDGLVAVIVQVSGMRQCVL